MHTDERRREIARFLRAQRTRRQPEEVGVPRGRRRRTPGLRREEVAAAAGVSTEWYTWLEQARPVRPSRETVRRVGEALRLEPGEMAHLLTLCGYGAERAADEAGAAAAGVSARLQAQLDQLAFSPAWVAGERHDFVAWNHAATALFGPLERMRGMERNGIFQLFLGPRIPVMLRGWEAHARHAVARLRASYARHVGDPWFHEVTDLLLERSPHFARWWPAQEVAAPPEGAKHYDHPELGLLVFDYTTLVLVDGGRAPLQVTTYVPVPGTGTRERMAEWAAAVPPAG